MKNLTKYPLVIFDLDGTLIDSTPKLTADVVDAMKRCGISITPKDVKGNWYALAENYGITKEQFDAELDKRMSWQEALKRGIVKMFPETDDVLRYLQSRKVKMTLLSRSIPEYTNQKVKHFGLERYFDITRVTPVSAKSKTPEALDIVRESNPSRLESVYCVGDSEEDLTIAQDIQDQYKLNSSGVYVNRNSISNLPQYKSIKSLNELSLLMGV